MALVLDLTYSQSNNATTLTVTDAAGTYHVVDNPTGWETGAATNPDVADIVISTDITTASKNHLLLDITVTDKDGITTIYDQLNLYDVSLAADVAFTGYTLASELTWDITPDMLEASGVAMGEATSKLDDGIYVVVYSLVLNSNHGTAAATALTESVLIDGDVRIDVYNKLRQIPVNYDYEAVDRSRDVMEALLGYAYLQAISASAAVAMTDELITMLYTLDKMNSDGSHYTW